MGVISGHGYRDAGRRSMSKVALVTGANQGLGFALVEGLAGQLQQGDVVYLTGRNAERVAAAGEHIAVHAQTCGPAWWMSATPLR